MPIQTYEKTAELVAWKHSPGRLVSPRFIGYAGAVGIRNTVEAIGTMLKSTREAISGKLGGVAVNNEAENLDDGAGTDHDRTEELVRV